MSLIMLIVGLILGVIICLGGISMLCLWIIRSDKDARNKMIKIWDDEDDEERSV